MSELRFDSAAEAPPYDRDQVLTPFEVVGVFPVPIPGERYPSQVFDGSNGWQVVTAPSSVNGFNAVTIRVVCRPDWVSMSDATFRALGAYGDGGPLASQHLSFAAGVIVGGGMFLLAGQYQTVAGVPKTAIINLPGSDIPAMPWVQITITRERSGDGHVWRGFVNGEKLGEIATTDSIAYVQDSPWTLAHISTLGVAGSFFEGTIESVDVLTHAATSEEEFLAYKRRLLQEESRELVADALPRARTPTERGVATERGSTYHAIRVRPLAELVGNVAARAANWNLTALPPTCYGSQLAMFERAFGIPTDTTIPTSHRQATVSAAMADLGGFQADKLLTFAATLTGDPSPVLIVGSNTFTPTSTDPGSPDVVNPWIVKGDGTVHLIPAGMELEGLTGATLRVAGDAITAAWPIAHERLDGDTRPIRGGMLSAELVSLAGSSITAWTGISLLRQFNGLHIGIWFDGLGYIIARRESTEDTYTPWQSLGNLAPGGVAGVFYDETIGQWFASWNNTPADLTTTQIAALPWTTQDVLSIALTNQSEGVLGADLTSVWLDPVVQVPNAETARKYYLVCVNATSKDAVGQTAQLRRRDRPTAVGHITYALEAVTDDTDSPADFTPLTGDVT
jgi:hypothetical protein